MAGTSLRLHIETEDREYPSMYKLKLQGKDLENVPAELFTLRELEVLCMSPDRQSSLNYKLCNVPPEIAWMGRMKSQMKFPNLLKLPRNPKHPKKRQSRNSYKAGLLPKEK
ncbi:hypothetical protein CRM22_006014 [Opisthorchis felineus]|uniref:Uncharacterized protein n=1 Tax=Opisthorchis felineus TaxID=147828 RepID=A0A4S2LN19_OPIFE|nr:hypothetical protein CRM22_006014 [Opisthorchis felineus]